MRRREEKGGSHLSKRTRTVPVLHCYSQVSVLAAPCYLPYRVTVRGEFSTSAQHSTVCSHFAADAQQTFRSPVSALASRTAPSQRASQQAGRATQRNATQLGRVCVVCVLCVCVVRRTSS